MTVTAEPGAEGWEPVRFRFFADGSCADAVRVTNGKFHMNGRAVVIFTLRDVPREIEELLATAEIKSTDIDCFVFHQGSKYILDKLRERLQLSSSQVPIVLRDYGNTVSSSIPLALEGEFTPGVNGRILCCGFGVGLSIGTMLLEYRNSES